MDNSKVSLTQLLCALALCLLSVAASAGAFQAPRVRAAPNGQHRYPFISTTLDLAQSGFIEQEFLISGTARAFTVDSPLQPDGRWNARPSPGITAPYTTRLLVRRPANPQRFNGIVLVEWFNESAGFDAPSEWLHDHEEILREGYAYVGVSAQYDGVQALLGWESGPKARYGSLQHPGDSFAYDIFTQAGWALNHDPLPLGNLTARVNVLLASGFSQSAVWLMTYYNAIHRLAPVYNAFLIHDGGFAAPLSLDFASFSEQPIPAGIPATPLIDTPYPVSLRTDQSTPVLTLESEFGLSDFGVGAARTFHLQPDSNRLRVWEIAGAPHLETGWFTEFVADVAKSIPGYSLDTCNGPPGIPSILHSRASRAALHALARWAADRVPPRSAPRLSLVVADPDQLVTFNRDPKTHVAVGGIRLPDVSVPTATVNGNRSDLDPQAAGPGAQCVYVGSYDRWNRDADSWDGQTGLDPSPTPEPDLQLLYQSHLDYVERVTRSTALSIREGYLRPADGYRIVVDAAHASIP